MYVANPIDYLVLVVVRLLAFQVTAEDGKATLNHRWLFTLAVVFNGVTAGDSSEMAMAEPQMLSAIVHPASIAETTKLEGVFGRIEYLSSVEKDIDMYLCPMGRSEKLVCTVLPRLSPASIRAL